MSNDIKLCSKKDKSTTPISNYFIDEYMSDANGEFLKIYLYLLRCINADKDLLSLSRIADKFNNTENDVKRALKYWEKMKLLSIDYSSDKKISSISILDIPQADNNKDIEDSSNTSNNSESVDIEQLTEEHYETDKKADSYSQDELKAFSEQKEIKQLLFITEQYLGKTLTSTETSKILYFYDTLKFPPDLIEYLFEYCVFKGHKSIRYIETVALEWHKSGLTSTTLAKSANDTYTHLYSIVMKSFGISGRKLIDAEKEYIKKWTNTYYFTSDLISEACKRTVITIHQPSFEYADSILTKWFNAKIKSITDIKAIDEQHMKRSENKAKVKTVTVNTNNKFNNFQQRTYDYAMLERKFLNTTNK